VLSGACLWVSRAILAEIGAFDERFFLYAEDIDLSYRIEQAGYVNYFSPAATIVHFKGESTRKDIRYVRQFYRAMRQFRQKHFNKGMPAVFSWGIGAAIRLREGWTMMAGLLRRSGDEHAGNDLLRTCIRGDAPEAARVTQLLAARGSRVIVEEEAAADELLLCEGEGFSFRQCIGRLEAVGKSGGPRVWFHAGGSGSAVGSPDRKDRGEALLL
jgi:hypothetical protein